MNVPYSITQDAITVVIGNRPKVVPCTAMNFSKLALALRQPTHDVELIGELADISTFIARVTHGEVQIAEGAVRWRGEAVKNVVAERLIELLQAGHDTTPMSNFLDRVMQNPLQTAKDELLLWLESGSQPVTPDGMILAFKRVDANYKDCHSHTFDNSVGQKPTMPREAVDPDRNNECSRGFHFCSFPYLQNFHGDHTMIVLVDPANVVAIPRDYNNQKGRCWTYEVVGEVENESATNFFTGSPVVEVHREHTIFVFGDTVKFIGSEQDAEDNSLTIGNYYTVLAFESNDVFLQNDAASQEWFDSALFVKETKTVTFEAGDEVEFIGTPADAEDYNITVGAIYVVLDGNSDDVYLLDDDAAGVYINKTFLRLANVKEEEPIAVEEEEVAVPEQSTGKAPLMFHHGAKTVLASELLNMVQEHGQRGYTRLTGVPRSTLQGWLKAIEKQAD